MINALERPSSWTGRLVLLAIAVLAISLHQTGTPERASTASVGALVAGVVIGLTVIGIVLARLLGRSALFITSDRAAIVTVVMLVVGKIAIARIFVP